MYWWGEGSWIGAGTTIIPGVKIGKWSVIGAGSVVTKDIPDHVLGWETNVKLLRVYKIILLMNKRIWLSLAHMGGREQDFIKEAFDTNWVVPLGPNVDAFEQSFG